MKKIYILAYSKTNLGDDLFVNILLKKYKTTQFYSKAISQESSIYKENCNLHYLDYSIDDLLDVEPIGFDGFIYIGGSIFMEHAGGIERIEKLNAFTVKCKEHNIPFYYISSNFGPYKTEEYKNAVKNLFSNSTDICLRDKVSYEMFKDIKTVRYAPDVVFSYKPKTTAKEENTIGISFINFKFRNDLKQYEEKYYELLTNTIKNFINKGYKIKLFSFCEYEGDADTITTILKKLDNTENVEAILYNGNLTEFLNIYSKMEYMICSRFHSMILSYLLQQKICVLSYSSKINNVISDLNLLETYFNIEDIDKINSFELKDFNNIVLNKDIVKESHKQFKKLDKFLIKEDLEKITVIIPARNEEKTIEKVVKLVQKNNIVDQIIVVDNASTDSTNILAKNAGAQVVFCPNPGKGFAMEEGIKHAQNEVIVFIDADISNYSKDLISNLAEPIIHERADFVKSMFDRQGGRVTELVAKPLLKILYPNIREFSQPLSGMIASKKSIFEQVTFEKDYGVDIGILLDVIHLGASVEEVHIGKIKNVSQPWQSLDKMSTEVMTAILKRQNQI